MALRGEPRRSDLSAAAMDWETLSALSAMMVCLFVGAGGWNTGRHQKGPHRRCFKMSSHFRLARIATGGVSSGYLTGFLTMKEVRRTPTGTCDFGRVAI